MKTTTVIDDQHPMSAYVVVVDANGDIIPKVKSYNTETQEAEVYVMDEKGHAIVDWPDGKGEGKHGVIRTEKKVLEGSRLVFREDISKDKKIIQAERITFTGHEPMKMFAIPDSLYDGIIGEKLNTIFNNVITVESQSEVPEEYKQVMYAITVNGSMTTDNVKTYLTNLNLFAEEGLIEHSCLSKPFIIPLALIHAQPRAILAFYVYSKYTIAELNDRVGTKQFQDDGELPTTILEGIPYHQQLGWNIATKPGEIVQINVQDFDTLPGKEFQTTEEQDICEAAWELIKELRQQTTPTQLEAQLGTFIDRRQYSVNICFPSGTVTHNDTPILLDMEFTPEDTSETIYKQITEAALRIQFPGQLKFEPSTYRFDITRL